MTLILGAVAYDPKVVGIWEGMRSYLRDEAKLDWEVALFLSYRAQVDALLAGRIDVAWNTNLAYLQAAHWSEGACRPLAMRDTDLDWTTKIIAPRGGPVDDLESLRGKQLALGSRDSGHAAILPVHFLREAGLSEGSDYQSLRFDSDVGKHGDTGRSELEVVKAVLDGRCDAGAVGSPFWSAAQEQELFPKGALEAVWTSPPFHHCMFTARRGLSAETGEAFVRALTAMRWDDPAHREILEAEGLRAWVPARLDGYASLEQAAREASFFERGSV